MFKGPTDVMLVIDNSAVFRPITKYQALLNFLGDIIRGIALLQGNVQIGVMTFGSVVTIHLPLTSFNSLDSVESTVR